jgi:hypothetical protein
VFLIVASLLLMGQTAANRVVEANQFVLRDTSGRIRAKLEVSKVGNPILNFMDTRGDVRMTLASNPEGGGISILGPNGESLNFAIGNGSGGLSMLRNGVEDFHLTRGPVTDKNSATGDLIYEGNDVSLGMYNGGGALDFRVAPTPSVTVTDKEGFQATLGSSLLTTAA